MAPDHHYFVDDSPAAPKPRTPWLLAGLVAVTVGVAAWIITARSATTLQAASANPTALPAQMATASPGDQPVAAAPARPMAQAPAAATVRFAFDSDTVTDTDRRALAALVRQAARSGGRIVVDGFADASGPADYNRQLAERRARAAEACLREAGLAVGRSTARGRGMAMPVGDNATREGRAKNRRAEVRLEPAT